MSSASIVRALKRQGEAGIKYEYAPSAPRPVPIDVAIDELFRIYKRDGDVTAEAVLAEATPEQSPLHSVCTWDDRVAATRHREEEVRHFLRQIVVVHRDAAGRATTPAVRAFVAVKQTEETRVSTEPLPNRGQVFSYIPVMDILSQDDLRADYLRRAQEALYHWRKRFEDIQEFARLFAEIDRILDEYGFERKAG